MTAIKVGHNGNPEPMTEEEQHTILSGETLAARCNKDIEEHVGTQVQSLKVALEKAYELSPSGPYEIFPISSIVYEDCIAWLLRDTGTNRSTWFNVHWGPDNTVFCYVPDEEIVEEMQDWDWHANDKKASR